MSQKRLRNRIAAEELEDCKPWVLPPIHGEQDQVLPSAEREAKLRAEQEQTQRNEKVEDVEYEGQDTGLSAEELQSIVDEAEAEGREQGYQAGFAQGRAEGYEAGEQQGRDEMRQTLVAEQQRFAHLVQSLRDPLETQEDALEKLLLDTVCALSKSLVERELLTDSSHILELVRRAVDALPAGADNLRIYLNPDDLALVEAYAEERQLNWQFHGDEALLPGGCRLETRDSQVNYSVEHRLKQQLEAFVNRQLDGDALSPDAGQAQLGGREPEASEEPVSGEPKNE